jgi:hypothetical protein
MRIKDELSRRERVLLAMAHRTTDRIPISDICGTLNPPAGEAFNNYLVRYHNTDAISYIVDAVDTRSITYFYNGPGLDAGEDPWGVRKKPVSYGAGSYDEICYYPLKDIQTAGELDRHRWPNADWFRYDIIKDMIKGLNGDQEYCIIAASAAPFETSWAMRGFEQTFMDMVTKPDLVHGIMQRVTDFYLESFRFIHPTTSAGKRGCWYRYPCGRSSSSRTMCVSMRWCTTWARKSSITATAPS